LGRVGESSLIVFADRDLNPAQVSNAETVLDCRKEWVHGLRVSCAHTPDRLAEAAVLPSLIPHVLIEPPAAGGKVLKPVFLASHIGT